MNSYKICICDMCYQIDCKKLYHHGRFIAFACEVCHADFAKKEQADACCKQLLAKPVSMEGCLSPSQKLTDKQLKWMSTPTALLDGSRDA